MDYRQFFDAIDTQNKGYITIEDLQRTDHEGIDQVIQTLQLEEGESLTFDQFRASCEEDAQRHYLEQNHASKSTENGHFTSNHEKAHLCNGATVRFNGCHGNCFDHPTIEYNGDGEGAFETASKKTKIQTPSQLRDTVARRLFSDREENDQETLNEIVLKIDELLNRSNNQGLCFQCRRPLVHQMGSIEEEQHIRIKNLEVEVQRLTNKAENAIERGQNLEIDLLNSRDSHNATLSQLRDLQRSYEMINDLLRDERQAKIQAQQTLSREMGNLANEKQENENSRAILHTERSRLTIERVAFDKYRKSFQKKVNQLAEFDPAYQDIADLTIKPDFCPPGTHLEEKPAEVSQILKTDDEELGLDLCLEPLATQADFYNLIEDLSRRNRALELELEFQRWQVEASVDLMSLLRNQQD